MTSAPVIHWLRPGVGYAPDAAASMRRLEADLGRPHDCNSSFRDPVKQLGMFNAWNAYAAGRGPKPPHSRAIHPDKSKHCQGLADDSDDWVTPGYIELAAEHGWIRTAASDPTERHHFEYQSWRDQHRNETAPVSSTAGPYTELMGHRNMLAIKNTSNDRIFAVTDEPRITHLGSTQDAAVAVLLSGRPLIELGQRDFDLALIAHGILPSKAIEGVKWGRLDDVTGHKIV